MESAVLEFWRDYLDSLPPDLDQPKPAGVFSFGDSKKLADELAALVRQGIKTATCSALIGYEKDQIPLPQKGDLSIVLDGSGNPVLAIETLSAVILPFNEVSEQFAFEEGEGDRSLTYWRMAREKEDSYGSGILLGSNSAQLWCSDNEGRRNGLIQNKQGRAFA